MPVITDDSVKIFWRMQMNVFQNSQNRSIERGQASYGRLTAGSSSGFKSAVSRFAVVTNLIGQADPGDAETTSLIDMLVHVRHYPQLDLVIPVGMPRRLQGDQSTLALAFSPLLRQDAEIADEDRTLLVVATASCQRQSAGKKYAVMRRIREKSCFWVTTRKAGKV